MTPATNITPATAIADLEKTLARRIAELKSAQAAERVLREQGQPCQWIVQSGYGLALQFDVDPHVGRLIRPRSCDPHKARRFATEAEAQAVADLVTDGHGAKGRAVALDTALAADLHELLALLGTVVEHLAGLQPKDDLPDDYEVN